MAYTPTEWETGDIITAEKLNNIEDGIVANEEAIDDAELNLLQTSINSEFLSQREYHISLSDITGDTEKAISEPEKTIIIISFTGMNICLSWTGSATASTAAFDRVLGTRGSAQYSAIYRVLGVLSSSNLVVYVESCYPESGGTEGYLLTSTEGHSSAQWLSTYKQNTGLLAVSADFSSASFTSSYVPYLSESGDVIADYIVANVTVGDSPMGSIRLNASMPGGLAYGAVAYNPLASAIMVVGITYNDTGNAWVASVKLMQ